MSVDVIVEEPRWDAHAFETLCDRAVVATLEHLGLAKGDWEVSVLACDDARIAALNGDFRSKPKATNVLSWPSEDRSAETEGTRPDSPLGDPELGDIAISYETCLREAEAGEIPLEHHTLHLLVHGTLHLLGYDHERDGDADLMEATEIAILCKLGVPDPY